jgi:hypothetical protein
MRLRDYPLVAVALCVVCVFGLTGCPPTTPLTTTVTPTVVTMGEIHSGGINPENCNDWTSPSWNTPQQWWNSLQPTQLPKVVGNGVVGSNILFDTRPGGGCTKFRQDLYRPGVTYSLAGLNLKGLVKSATITFSSVVLPSGVSTTGLCQPMTGGGGSLLILRFPATVPAGASAFADLGGPGPQATPFPASATVFGMTFPWVPGPITSGVQTGVTVSTQASGTGAASFTVDVTAYINGSFNRGDGSIAFMLSGSDENAPSVFPPGALDCRTVYSFGSLNIVHF